MVELVAFWKMVTNGKEDAEFRILSTGPMQKRIAIKIPKPKLPLMSIAVIMDLGIIKAAFSISSAVSGNQVLHFVHPVPGKLTHMCCGIYA